MARTTSFNYWVWVFLRMGEITVLDLGHRRSGGPVGSEKVVRLDPAAVGKAIQQHAVPRLAFTEKMDTSVRRVHEVCTDAVGAPNGANLDRTSAMLHVFSDGHEARFEGTGPTLRQDDTSRYIRLDNRLSARTPIYSDDPLLFEAVASPFWVAPWRDAEMLGHAVLAAFGLARSPIGEGMMPSVFDPLEPKRRLALHRAASDGDMGALPGSGSRRKLDLVDAVGVTPLMLAAENGHVGAVERLLELGASHSLADGQGRSALHYASESGCDGAVGLLLEAGAEPSAPDSFGETALHLAAAGGFVESVLCLLGAGADPAAADAMYGSTPLHRSARADAAGVVAALVEFGARVDAANEVWRTALHVAAAYGHVETARVLIELGADLDFRDCRGETPMFRAVFFQHMAMIGLLINHGASVDARDIVGNRALHVAAAMNRDAAAQALVDAGADVEARNREGLTALDLAIVNQHRYGVEHNAEAAQTLLEHGATIDPERIPVGDRHALWPHLTPLQLLASTGDIDYTKLPDLPDQLRKRLPHSDDRGYPTISEVVTSLSLLHDAATKNMAELVETLLRHGASVMTAVRMHGTPLHDVARHGTREMAALLLDHGADLEMPICNTPDSRFDLFNHGRRHGTWMSTPLDVARRSSRKEMAEFLLQKGAKPLPDD